MIASETRRWYDFITVSYVLILALGAGYAIWQLRRASDDAFSFLSVFADLTLVVNIILPLSLLYSCAVIVLSFKKDPSILNNIFMIIGSFFFPGILALIVYTTHLRKRLNHSSDTVPRVGALQAAQL